MERRLQKDFQIGIVEGIVQAVIQSEKEPKDVFSQIAKAIGRKGSGTGRKDWNAVVRQSTIVKDPIGSTNEAVQRQTRLSLRRRLRHQPDSDLASMDPKRLVDYNPNLSEFTPVTRIAYAKFMMSKNKPNEQADDTNDPSNANEESVESPRRSRKVMKAENPDMIPRPVVKKSILKSISSGSVDKSAERILDIKIIETRSPSPIPENPVEEEASKQSTSLGTSDQERKIEEKDNYKKESAQEQKKKNGETSEAEKLEEQKKEKKEKNKDEQSGNTEKNKSEKTEGKTSETNEENDKEKCIESDAKEKKTIVAPVQTTQLRGKSKATGQIMGGWI
ncbi:transient receptor potential protein [Lasius niger]|uniref:Transient receptor potential protein n=1 Tax=Lasius niger TaxID=67767 RepID=A0A0J7K132_LASNI|nr:transient receptor potential protein [Lasius niger]